MDTDRLTIAEESDEIIFDPENPFHLPRFRCLRCGHQWYPRSPKAPVKCPKCKSVIWNKPKTK